MNADGMSSDLSGIYSYQKKNGSDLSNQIIGTDIKNGTQVSITQKGNAISISYERENGRLHQMDLSPDKNLKWDKGKLVYTKRQKPSDAAILPGYARQTRKGIYYKDENGNLVIESSFTEKGLMLFLIPFTDHYKNKLVLARKEN